MSTYGYDTALARAIDDSQWPYPKGQGHLGVKWSAGVEWNKQELSRRIAVGEFTAAQALHRMTDGAVNTDGTLNGPRRPTLASKWGPAGLARVGAPKAVVDAHVDALKQHLISLIRVGPPALASSTASAASAATKRKLSGDAAEQPVVKRPAAPALGQDAAAAAVMLAGVGAGHPKIFVAKANSVRANQQELFRRVRRPRDAAAADCSVDHALHCMRADGPLRMHWKARADPAVGRHIDELCTWLRRLRERVRNGTFDGEPHFDGTDGVVVLE